MAGAIAKIAIFTFNCVFLLVGLGVMSVGIIALVDPDLLVHGANLIPGFSDINYIVDLQQALVSSGIILTCIGSIIALMCIIGLVGSCTGGACLVGTYIGLVALMLAFQLAVIIYNAVDYTNSQNKAQDLMYDALVKNFQPVHIDGSGGISNSTNPGAASWTTLQFEYGCCGAHGYEDFDEWKEWKENFTYFPPALVLVPPSCCMQKTQYKLPSNTAEFVNLDNCLQKAPEHTNTRGCYYAVTHSLAAYANITIIVIASLIALEVIVLMLSMHLINIKERHSKTGYA